jgi:hypothetical protein
MNSINSALTSALTNKKENIYSDFNLKQKQIINCFVINNKGKIIFSRQFMEITKRKLFDLAFLFDRNLNIEHNKTKNTFLIKESFEIDNKELKIRFTYQTMHSNNLFLVLTTQDDFNIFESLDLIRIIHRKITEMCQFTAAVEDDILVDKIKSKVYDIILCLDDVINSYFGAEEKNISQLLLNLNMESSEAEQFLKEKEIKEKNTREQLIKGMEGIERLKRENKYVDNSVSSEMFENKNESNQMLVNNDLLNEKSNSNSLNLKDRLIQKFIEHREEVLRRGIVYIIHPFNLDPLSIACENMIKTMILSEITRGFSERQSIDEDEYEDATGPILIPLQLIFDASEWEDEF